MDISRLNTATCISIGKDLRVISGISLPLPTILEDSVLLLACRNKADRRHCGFLIFWIFATFARRRRQYICTAAQPEKKTTFGFAYTNAVFAYTKAGFAYTKAVFAYKSYTNKLPRAALLRD